MRPTTTSSTPSSATSPASCGNVAAGGAARHPGPADRRRREGRGGHQRRRRRSTRRPSGSRTTCFSLLSLQQPVAGDLRTIVVRAADGQRARADGRPLGARRQDRPAAGARPSRCPTRSARRSRGWPRSPRTWSPASRRSSPSATSRPRSCSAATTTRWTTCAAPASPQLLSDDWAHGVEAAVDIALLGRYYERIADHAVSVGNRVVFVVTGQFPSTSRPRWSRAR